MPNARRASIAYGLIAASARARNDPPSWHARSGLTRRNSFTMTPTAPFHFDATLHKPSHFPAPLDAWEPGRYWQAPRIGGEIFGIKIENRGTRARPTLRVTVFHRAWRSSAFASQPTKPAAHELRRRIAQESDFVIERWPIVGHAQRAVCTTRMVRDEEALDGNRSSVFADAANRQAEAPGLPEVRRGFVPHPIQDTIDDDILAKADAIVNDVIAALKN